LARSKSHTAAAAACLPAGGPGKGTSVWGGGVRYEGLLRKNKEEKTG